MKTYTPKGSMCASCINLKEDCSKLDFKKMRVIEKFNNQIIVRCTGFEANN